MSLYSLGYNFDGNSMIPLLLAWCPFIEQFQFPNSSSCLREVSIGVSSPDHPNPRRLRMLRHNNVLTDAWCYFFPLSLSRKQGKIPVFWRQISRLCRVCTVGCMHDCVVLIGKSFKHLAACVHLETAIFLELFYTSLLALLLNSSLIKLSRP